MSNAAIARERKTSVRTVANQVASLFRKTGARSRAEIARIVARSARG
jgi:DNA-binding NarL/FixJ family response regulator